MATQKTKTASNDMQSLFDAQGYQDVFKTLASSNERVASIAVEAATKSTDIATDAAKEAFSNLRDMAAVRDEPADYGKAYSDFVQKQTDLFMRTAQSFGNVTQQFGAETTEFASKAGEEITSKATANAESAAQKVSSAAGRAA